MNIILTNGIILDVRKGEYLAKSLLISGNRIKCLGSLQECRLAAPQNCEIIDLKGRIILPSFTDAHTHFVEYAKARILVDLSACHSLTEMHDYLKNYRQQLDWDARWILGGSWDRNKLDNPQELNRYFLDSLVPDLPVALMSKDYHSMLLNSLALKLAGINKTSSSVPGGYIERDMSGEPTGIVSEAAIDLVRPLIVEPADQQVIQALRTAVENMYSYGITGFHSMESAHSRNLLHSAFVSGKRFRLCWHFMGEDFELAVSGHLASYQGDEWFKTGGLKLFGDGSLGSQTAAMFQPYPDGSKGILRYSDEELFALLQRAAEHGFASTIHAIGDRCVAQVIRAVLRLREQPQYRQLFHRLEHVQCIRQEDIPLLKASGLFASVQPVHLANDVPMIHIHWSGSEAQAYAFGSMLKQGIPLAFGTDAPIESLNPFRGIFTALERRSGFTGEVFGAAEKLSLEQALRAYTLGAAEASQSEAQRGSIEPGKLADLMILDDYRKLPSDFWLQASSRLTMLDGEIVFSDL